MARGSPCVKALVLGQERAARSARSLRGEALQLGLFDQRRLFELTQEAYPGKRLIACRNPELAKLRAHKRQSLLEASKRPTITP